ncbi:hypothetical protein CAPTEDRAFT_185514 [Capitella teleta]|uniref:VWFD domain-containing protein n=1 Tax=Capitella teleta TaxID=283909 RepID=R7TZB5_CAPTE|nr:hypothetical protein CAPTEDRAFT_185514 [Capitella teleta]|eukprot:ELT96270.1 hypothetical protein CAPTEDRAFT_185514 [Capitella teleta]
MKVLVSCLVVLLPLLRASSVSIYDDLQNEIGNSDNTAHSRESRATKLEKWCIASGDPHFITFDNENYDFQGMCKYLLAGISPEEMDYEPFSIYAKHVPWSSNLLTSYVHYVEIHVYGYIIKMGQQKRVWIDGVVQQPRCPISLDGNNIRIEFQQNFVHLTTDFGLRVKYDGEWIAYVYVPEDLRTQGLCGNNDGVGNYTNLLQWQVDDPAESKCRVIDPPSECTQEQRDVIMVDRYCGHLFKFSSSDCSNETLLEALQENCVYDVCAVFPNVIEMQEVSCHHLESFPQACNGAFLPETWRKDTTCVMECPGDLVYNARGSMCPDTCQRPFASQDCPEEIGETCECPGDTVIGPGNTCLTPLQCVCGTSPGTQGSTAIGGFFLDDDCKTKYTCKFCDENNINNGSQNETDCQFGYAQLQQEDHWCRPTEFCNRNVCEEFSKCSAGFDIHIHTFDLERFSYHGICKYNLASFDGSADIPAFRVLVKTERRYSRQDVSYAKYFELQVYDEVIRLSKKHPTGWYPWYRNIFIVNNSTHDFSDGMTMSLADGRITLTRKSRDLIATTDFGLKVDWHLDRWGNIYIPKQWNGIMSGMCGNNNGDIADDLVAKNGTDMRKIPYGASHLGISWHVDDPEEPNCVSAIDPEISICESEVEIGQVNRNDTRCGLISTRDSPFRECLLSIGDVEGFQTDCRFDVCANILNETVAHDEACAHLEMLFNECQLAGFLVDWRDRAKCPMDCRGGSEYRLNTSPCIDKCGDPIASQQCVLPKTEGCVCPDQKLFKDGVCVSPYECGCVDETGVEHKIYHNADIPDAITSARRIAGVRLEQRAHLVLSITGASLWVTKTNHKVTVVAAEVAMKDDCE